MNAQWTIVTEKNGLVNVFWRALQGLRERKPFIAMVQNEDEALLQVQIQGPEMHCNDDEGPVPLRKAYDYIFEHAKPGDFIVSGNHVQYYGAYTGSS